VASGNFSYLKVFSVLGIAILFCIVLCTPASAETYTVCPSGCNFTSIQEAINFASDGDTIEVLSGTYHEAIVVNRSVNLKGIDTDGDFPDIGKYGEPVMVTISAPGVTFEQFWVHGAAKNALALEADVVRVHEIYFAIHRPDEVTDPVVTGTGLSGVEISDCMMTSTGALGIILQDCSQVFVLDNWVSVNPDTETTPIAISACYTPQAGSYSDIGIEDNAVDRGAIDVGVLSLSGSLLRPYLYNIRVCNNVVDESGTYGISVGGDAEDNEGQDGYFLHNVTVEQNTVTNFTARQGIGVAWAGDGAISGNAVSDGSGDSVGLIVADSTGFSVNGNSVTRCDLGISLDSVRSATLSGNTMTDNTMNFGVTGREIDQYRHSVDTTNTVDGRPIYYLVDQVEPFVDGSTGAGTVYAVNCTEVGVRDLVLRNNMCGVALIGSNHAEITNVTATNNSEGFRARNCTFVRFGYCSATDNDEGYFLKNLDKVRIYASEASSNTGPLGSGISLYGCSGVDLLQVNANSNSFTGIDISGSDEVALEDVTLEGNEVGLILDGMHIMVTGCHIRDNSEVGIGFLNVDDAGIWNNYFNNDMNVDLHGNVTGAVWNVGKTEGPNIVDGPFIGGNYWANPEGTGWSQVTPNRGDGFCNARYVIDQHNVDLLPLHLQATPPFYADFTADPLSGDAPLTVQFTDISSGEPFRWYYQFGDGYSSTSKNPVHTYRNPGTYTVTLSIMSRENTKVITTTTEKVGYLTVKGMPEDQLVANFTASPMTGEAPLVVSFTDTSTGNPTGYRYSFGDLSVSAGPDPVHTYRRPGTYDVQLTVWTTAGGNLKSNTTACRNCITVT
jgi:parallel beta-helix repeat protein